MSFKKRCNIIIYVMVIISLFIATAVIQHNNLYTDTTELNTSFEESQEPITELTTSCVKIEEPQTSGYNISYVNKEFDKHLLQVMKDFNIKLDASYVYSTIFCESTFRCDAQSPLGAIGYMQVMPDTRDYISPMIKREFTQYSKLSNDLTDPYTNVVYGLYYFSYIAKNFGDTEVNEENLNKVLTCYNKGITGGKKYLNRTGNWNSNYAKKIIKIAEQIRTNGGM